MLVLASCHSYPFPTCSFGSDLWDISTSVIRYDGEGTDHLEDSAHLYSDSKFSLLGSSTYVDPCM